MQYPGVEDRITLISLFFVLIRISAIPTYAAHVFFASYGKKSEGSRGAVSREWQPLMLSGRKDGFHLENNVSFFCDRVEKEGGIWDIWCVGAQGKVPISLSSKVIPSAMKWGASEHTFRYFPTRFVTKGMRGLMGDQILIDAYLVTSKQRDSLGRSRC